MITSITKETIYKARQEAIGLMKSHLNLPGSYITVSRAQYLQIEILLEVLEETNKLREQMPNVNPDLLRRLVIYRRKKEQRREAI